MTLPPYVFSSSTYESFDYKNDCDGTKITLCKTNLLDKSSEREFIPYFSENSFSKTLQRLIKYGEYVKTKEHNTPMYCFGSTIMCTRFPKFFSEGKPQILPRPYRTLKPGSKGYDIIRSTLMQSFLKEVEYHVLHYLHNMCKDKALRKMTLFNIELAKKIIPEYLRLGDTFFTHMSVFGTVNKADGQMRIHFDERDLISCVFYLGQTIKGGATSFYAGSKAEEPGDCVHQVPFRHGNLQIVFFLIKYFTVSIIGRDNDVEFN